MDLRHHKLWDVYGIPNEWYKVPLVPNNVEISIEMTVVTLKFRYEKQFAVNLF